ncbi:MAG: fibronectin type III domain-containing protein [Nitrospirae bacterium]|nr:fibronectin type III domain-containing protein [Nitrospirota bacterium]
MNKIETKEKIMLKKNFLIYLLIPLILLAITGCGSGGSGGGGNSSSNSNGSESSQPNALTGSISIAWSAPDTNTDNLAGYKVYYGQGTGNYTNSVDIGNNTEAAISGLTPGTWCFTTTAYDSSGNESEHSNEACTEITASS